MARALRFPSAIQIDTFAKGRIEILKFRVPEGCVLNDLKVMDIVSELDCDVLAAEFEAAMAGFPCARIGSATTDGQLTITAKGSTVLQAEIAELKSIWKNGLTPFY